MAEQTQTTKPQEEREISYIAFGSPEEIRLNPSIIKKFFVKPSKNGRWPSEVDYYKFMALCKARQLNPYEGDVFLVGYDTGDTAEWSIITSLQTFLKRAEMSATYDGKESGVTIEPSAEIIARMEAYGLKLPVDGLLDLPGDYVPKGCTLVAGWCKVFSKKWKTPEYKRLDLRVFDKGTKFWQRDRAGMIAKTAEADALRSALPTVLGGLLTSEEMGQTVDVESTVAPQSAPKFLNPPTTTTLRMPPKREPEPVQRTAEPPAPKAKAKAAPKPPAVKVEPQPAPEPTDSGRNPLFDDPPAGVAAPPVKSESGIENTRRHVLQLLEDEGGLTTDALMAWGMQTGQIADSVEEFDHIDHRTLLKIVANWGGIRSHVAQIQAELR